MKFMTEIDLLTENNLKNDVDALSLSLFCHEPFTLINDKVINQLKETSLLKGNVNIRVCMHSDIDSNLHDMIILMRSESYCRPHMHTNTDETVQIIEGKLLIVLFEENGNILRTGIIKDNEMTRIPVGTFHTLMSLTPYVIFHESKSGPFIRDETVFAKWSPQKQSKEGLAYDLLLKNKVLTDTG